MKNVRGINDGKNLEEAYVRNVYDVIKHNEIKLKDEMQEWDSIMQKKPAQESDVAFETSVVGSHDSDIFHMMWSHCENSLCVVFETTGDAKVLKKVVDGFQSAVHIAEFHNLTEVPNSLVTSLCRILDKFHTRGVAELSTHDEVIAYGRSQKAQVTILVVDLSSCSFWSTTFSTVDELTRFVFSACCQNCVQHCAQPSQLHSL